MPAGGCMRRVWNSAASGNSGLLVFVLQFGEAGDNAAAVTEHADRTALPVTFLGLVGGFQLTDQVDHHIGFPYLRQTLQTGHEARPRTAFQLVKHRCVLQFFRHRFLLPYSLQLGFLASRIRLSRCRLGQVQAAGTAHETLHIPKDVIEAGSPTIN